MNIVAPPLPYVAVAELFKLPSGMNFRGTSGVAFNSKGNIFVIHRGPMPLMEFDPDGNFIRGFGDGLFERSHGLRIDAQDNIWATDVAANMVYKFDPSGRIEMVLGVKGHTGEWHPFGHLRLFHEPNEAVVGPAGDIFVLQGHGKGDPRVLKFDKDGTFIKTWGGKGRDRANSICRTRSFSTHKVCSTSLTATTPASRSLTPTAPTSANSQHPGPPCGLFMGADQHIWLAHGHTGEIMKLDLAGKVVGMIAGAGPGKTSGKYGEAHYIAVSPRDEIFVADTLNWRVQKYVRE